MKTDHKFLIQRLFILFENWRTAPQKPAYHFLEGIGINSSIQPTDTGDKLWWDKIREIIKDEPGKGVSKSFQKKQQKQTFFNQK